MVHALQRRDVVVVPAAGDHAPGDGDHTPGDGDHTPGDGDSAPELDPRAAERELLRSLDPEHREAFLLKHVEELSYDEMAEATGVGVSALKMRVKRACARLRDLLGEDTNGE